MTHDIPERYLSDQVQRCFRLMFSLEGRIVAGASPGELAKALAVDPSCITRDLANLRAAGVVTQIPETGRYRLSPRIGQIGLQVLRELDDAERNLGDLRNRFTRS